MRRALFLPRHIMPARATRYPAAPLLLRSNAEHTAPSKANTRTYSMAEPERLWSDMRPSDSDIFTSAVGVKMDVQSKNNQSLVRAPVQHVGPPKGKPKSSPQRRLGQKRRPSSMPTPAPTQRQRTEPPKELMDEEWVRRHFELPKREDFPEAPRGLFTSANNFVFNSNENFIVSKKSTVRHGEVWRCTVESVVLGKTIITAVGEGFNKGSAQEAAALHIIAKLHQTDILRERYSDAHEVVLDSQTLADEATAKEDIYNYAAKFGYVPKFSIRAVTRPLRSAGTKRVAEVTIDLPQHGIKAIARNSNLRLAEIAASLKFKDEAEKYHAEHGDQNIVVKDSTALNSSNARTFFDYYKVRNPTAVVEVSVSDSHTSHLKQHKTYRGQLSINGEPVGEPVEMIKKAKAEVLAYLTAAVAVVEKDPDLLTQFLQAPKSSNGDILMPMTPIKLTVDSDCILAMQDTMQEAQEIGLSDLQEDLEATNMNHDWRPIFRRPLAPRFVQSRSSELLERHKKFLADPALEDLRNKKEELPMNMHKAQVIDMVGNHVYSIIVGATGSGKTTQVPQILLELAISKGEGAKCNIICTQPRRIAATSVARRVAVERNETLQQSIGYHVRHDAKLPQFGGSITYCTTGILLQQLHHDPVRALDGISHLIIDEVHERDILIDFLLIVLKNVQRSRLKSGKHMPKVVLMSATMDTELFAGYFGNEVVPKESLAGCPLLSVPGRAFPVKEYFLPDILKTLDETYSGKLQLLESDIPTRTYLYSERNFMATSPCESDNMTGINETVIDWKRERVLSSEGDAVISKDRDDALVPIGLVATTIAHIARSTDEGAILIFLPGLDGIVKVDDALRQQKPLGVDFSDASKYNISMLHSSIPAGQTDVFNPVPPGCRKIILSTNIAETSVTIPDVQFVVDTGKMREKRYDHVRRITELRCTWISKSSSKQRAGRAGRVQNGNYYALFSKSRYDSLRVVGLPEMLRSDLQEICLDIRAQGFKAPIHDFLSEAIEPPSRKSVQSSLTELQNLEALTINEELTPLGRLLASLPVHPSLGKMIVLGIIFRCLDPMLILGAAMSDRSIFVTPLEAREEADRVRNSFVRGSGSDHIALLNAFRQMRVIFESQGQHALANFAFANFIHLGAFKSISQTAKQIEEILVDAGLIPFTRPSNRYQFEYGDPMLNENSGSVPLIKGLTLAGAYPNLAVSTGGVFFRTQGEKTTVVHPSSINYTSFKQAKEESFDFGTLLTYSTMSKANEVDTLYLRETSQITPLMATIFGGRLRAQSTDIELDFWLPFRVRSDPRAVRTILEFRQALDRLLTGSFKDLSMRGSDAEGFLADNPTRAAFARGLVEVLDRDVRVKEAVASRGWRKDETRNKDERRDPPSNRRRQLPLNSTF